MNPEPVCRWYWFGDMWIQHPDWPHNCPAGEVCATPAVDGGIIGQEVDTHCTQA